MILPYQSSNIDSFISLYMLAKYTHYTYLNNDTVNMGPLPSTLIFSFPLNWPRTILDYSYI